MPPQIHRVDPKALRKETMETLTKVQNDLDWYEARGENAADFLIDRDLTANQALVYVGLLNAKLVSINTLAVLSDKGPTTVNHRERR